MGNWRRAMIEGTCAESEVPALREAVRMNMSDFSNFHCLMSGGVCGLPLWPAATITAIGNLAERGYDEHSIAETLEKLAGIAPSLTVKVHLGNDYEAEDVTHTIALDGGKAKIGEPERATLAQVSDEQMAGKMVEQLSR